MYWLNAQAPLPPNIGYSFLRMTGLTAAVIVLRFRQPEKFSQPVNRRHSRANRTALKRCSRRFAFSPKQCPAGRNLPAARPAPRALKLGSEMQTASAFASAGRLAERQEKSRMERFRRAGCSLPARVSPCDHVPVAQLDRVSASEAEGYRFDSCRGYFTPDISPQLRGGANQSGASQVLHPRCCVQVQPNRSGFFFVLLFSAANFQADNQAVVPVAKRSSLSGHASHCRTCRAPQLVNTCSLCFSSCKQSHPLWPTVARSGLPLGRCVCNVE